MLYPSTMYRIGGVDPQKAGNAWERIAELMEAAERKGRVSRARSDRAAATQPGRVAREPDADPQRGTGSAVSGIDAEQLAWGEVEGRPPGLGHLPVHPRVDARFERAYIAEIAPQIGIPRTRRGARRVISSSEDDVLDCADFVRMPIAVNGGRSRNMVAGNV